MKNSGEIHEQLVTYDEEGGGEMDTNGYGDEKKQTILFRKPECYWIQCDKCIHFTPVNVSLYLCYCF